MFCPNCGKELPDNAKFCVHCGKSVIGQDQKGVHQSIIQDHAAPEQDSSDAAGGTPQKSVIFTQKKSKNTKVFICLAAALVLVMGLVIGVVFAIRASNEQAMIREIPFAIYNDGGGEKVEAYYKDYFGESLTIGFSVEDFSITRGADSNSYNLTGKFEATDISQDSRPTYDAYVTGTVTTNFFRTKWSINWSLQYQTPEDKNVISLQTLFQAYSSNAALADSTYANQYLNVSGTITDIRNTYSNAVEVELGIPTELFYASFEFNSNDTALYDLQVGNQITLTGYLSSGGSTYTLWFIDASIYKREFTAHNATTPAPDPVASAQPSNNYPDTEAGRILNRYAGSYMDDYGNYLFVGADESERARAELHLTGAGINYPISVVFYDMSTNENGPCTEGNDYDLVVGSMPTCSIKLGETGGTDQNYIEVGYLDLMYGSDYEYYYFYRTDPGNIPYPNPYH